MSCDNKLAFVLSALAGRKSFTHITIIGYCKGRSLRKLKKMRRKGNLWKVPPRLNRYRMTMRRGIG
jgi:hypothetical protein